MRALICAAVLLVTPSIAAACPAVQAIVAPSYSQAFVAPVVAAPVYQPQVQAVTVQPVVAAYAAPVVQQVVVQKVRVHHQQFRTPVRSALRGGRCR